MDKFINAEAFKRKLINEKGFFPAIVAGALEEMPAADVIEVKHGKWISFGNKFFCSICKAGEKQYYGQPLCSECGAIMDGGD